MPSRRQTSDLTQAKNPQTPPPEEVSLAPVTPGSPVPAEPDSWSEETKEVLDSLPRLWTRGLLHILIAFTAIVVPWTLFTKIDETGTARGRLEPQEQTVEIDSSVNCTVTSIPISEGDQVVAGQVLAECDADLVRTDLTQAEQQLASLKEQLTQLEAQEQQLKLAKDTRSQQNNSQQLEKQTQIDQAQETLDSLTNSYSLEAVEKTEQINQARQSLAIKEANYELAKTQLNKAQEDADSYQRLYDSGGISEEKLREVLGVLEEKQKALETAQLEIDQAQSYLTEKQNSYARLIQEKDTKIAQARLALEEAQQGYNSLGHSNDLNLIETEQQIKKIQTEITTLKSSIEDTNSKIESLKIQLEQYTFSAPISGTIFSLPVTGAGAVIKSGDLVAAIAPENSQLILRAELPASESGFLEVGMEVKLKFDAYPFQDYGLVEGQLSWVSPTSRIMETAQGQVKVYDVEITIANPYIHDGNNTIPLTAGQTATAEIVVRQRRVIDFLLEPFKQLQSSGLEI